tara:strand:+ start:165 stop:359 length:195 start_codon:yes stop_codon:yes gene_type:complete
MKERSWYLLVGLLISISFALVFIEWHDEWVPRLSIYILFGAGNLFGYGMATLILNHIYGFLEDE